MSQKLIIAVPSKGRIMDGVFDFFANAGLPNLTVGAGVLGPIRAYRQWPADGPQRYSEVTNEPLISSFTADSSVVSPGDPVALSWSVANTTIW